MKAIIIAAGACKRLSPLCQVVPKCLLPVKGRPILAHSLDAFRKHGISDISLIRGYKKEKFTMPELTYFDNDDYMNNNILHSFLCARPKLEEAADAGEAVIASYSDIVYEDSVLHALIASNHAIASVVDTEWQEQYDGRTDHPYEEAENVIMDARHRMLKIGKDVVTEGTPKNMQGEFIGLWKFTAAGIKIFLGHVDRINGELQMTEPFQNAKEWQKAYITDMFQELIDRGEKLYCVPICKQWAEFDTVQDYGRTKD